MRLAVGNSGTGLTNAYSGTGAMTSTASTIRLLDDAGGAADEDKIQVIGTAAKFTALPASNRMFLVSGAVTYICNSTAQTLRRFAKYTIGAAVPVSETDGRFTPAAVENTVVGNNVVACRITCSSTAAPGCRDTLIVDMAVSRPTLSPDLMRVLLEEPVDNTP